MTNSIGPIKDIINKYGSAKVKEALRKATKETMKTISKGPDASKAVMEKGSFTGRDVLNVAREAVQGAFAMLNKGKADFDEREIAHIEKFARLIAGEAVAEVKNKQT